MPRLASPAMVSPATTPTVSGRNSGIVTTSRDAFHRGQGLGFRTDRLAVVDGPAAGGVGHGGFTGTELAVDRERGTVVVLLTNRLHPAPPHADIGPVWDALLAAVAAAVDGA